jgi:RING finger protein 121
MSRARPVGGRVGPDSKRNWRVHPDELEMEVPLGASEDTSEEVVVPQQVHLKHHIPMPGHEDHEAYHSILLLLLFALMIGLQIALFLWRKKYPMAFLRVTLVFLWLIPLAFSIYFVFFRFLLCWTLFSSITGYIVKRSTEMPLQNSTPKLIWRFFLATYRICMGVSLAGYILILLEFIGLADFLGLAGTLAPFGTTMIFYGLYFGVLWRDIAEICTDRLASSLFITGDLPLKAVKSPCSLCRDEIANNIENSYTLACSHQFHESCLRGWTIVGKKDVCPCCKEKVDLKAMFPGGNPWARRSVLWAHLLDAIRYLIVWNPLIMVFLQVFLYITDPPTSH